MAAITADGRQELVALYLTMFNRAPTTIEMAQMVLAREAGSTLAQIATTLAARDDFAIVAVKDAQGFAEYLAGQLLAADTPAAARAWAINWVVTNVSGTKTKAQVIAEAIQAIRATTNTNYTTAKAELTADVTAALKVIDTPPPVKGAIVSLTISATDAETGTTADDTFIGQLGQSITLQASDTLDGSGGTADVLRIVSDGATAQSAGGFTTSNIEILEVQSQAVGGTTLSLENVSGLTEIRSSSSSTDITLNNIKAITPVTFGTSVTASALTINYGAVTLFGTADTQKVTVTGSNTGALSFAGIETIEVNSITGALGTTIGSLAGGTAFSKLVVTGDKALSIGSVTAPAPLPATVTTVDASAKTAGGVTLTVGAADVAVKGGAGNDTITFTGSLTSADSYDGGAGADTIIANVAELKASDYAVSSKITSVETIRFADALATDFDAGKLTGDVNYTLASFTGPVTISRAEDASTLSVRGASTGTLTYSIGDGATLATATGTANTLTVALGVGITGNGINAGTINTSGVETLNIASNGTQAVATATVATPNIVTIVDAEATSVKVTGVEDLTLSLVGTNLTTLDASASTGINDFTGVSFKASTAATITGGTHIDRITGSAAGDTINGGTGNDVITGGGGADSLTGGAGNDTFTFTAAADSNGASQDTINDFTSGSDVIGVSALALSLGRPAVVLKNGAAADFGSAQSAIQLNSGTTQAVFQADTKTLWIDLNDDGTLNNNDLAIKMTGVSSITAADLAGTGSGNSITLTATTTAVTTASSTGATGTTTVFADSISSTAANVVAATASVDGSTGTDTLTVTDALTAALDDGLINIENLVLGNFANTVIDVNEAGAFKNITGGTGADTIADTLDIIEGGSVSLGDGNDVITLLSAFEAAGNVDTSVKFNIDMGAGDDMVTTDEILTYTSDTTLAGGLGTDTLTIGAAGADIKGGNVTGFENLANGAGVLTLTAAQYNQFTGTNTNAGTITLSDAGALTIKAAGTFNLGTGTNTVTVATGATGTINGSGGADSFTATDTVVTAATLLAGAGGTDTLTVTSFDSAVNLAAKSSGFENVILQGTGTGSSVALDDVALAGAATVDASALTAAGTTVTTGELLVGAVTSLTVKGSAFADTIARTATSTTPSTFNLNNGDSVTTDTNLVIDTYNITANATGTTSVTIASSDGAAPDDVIKLFNSAGTQINVQGFVLNSAAFSGGGVVSAKATDDGTNTVVQIDMNGDGLFGASDIQVTLTGVSDGSAGDGQALFGITAGALSVL